METEVVLVENMNQMGCGEFVVSVWEWLPERLKHVFRDQYIVSLVQGWDKGVPDERAVGMAAMVGVVRIIQSSKLSNEVLC